MGPLPHPAGQEFALPSNSAGFWAKLSPKLPLLPLLLGLCLGLACLRRGARLPPSRSAWWPVTPATCPWVLPGAEQGLEGALGPPPACPASSWGTGWGAPGILLSTGQDPTLSPSQLISGPPASPWQSSTRFSALQTLGHSVRRRAKTSPALAPPIPSPCPEALGKAPL